MATVCLTTACLATVLTPSLASAQPVDAPSAHGAAPAAVSGPTGHPSPAPLRALTLVTGDVVRYTGSGSTLQVVSTKAPRARHAVAFATVTDHGDKYVIPSDAWRQVADGSIDKSLFDVSLLVADRLDDAHTKTVGVIVAGRPNRPPIVRIPAAAKATTNRLADLGVRTVSVGKPNATTVWNAVADVRDGRTRVPAGTKLWLDGTVRATLDTSVPLIGAPQAWKLGYTGKGVTVAVLDSGIDTQHRDLRGKVVAAKNFSESGSVDDHFGHGTHVASIVTGTGAASGGRYRGVAPGVKLLNGKVLGDDGSGQYSAILAGMQWAVTQGAKIVNMSLGGRSSDGTDVLSAQVNALSKAHGTLFVIAAGNAGAPGSVTAPGAAQAALTVASTTKQDKLSYFSSQGPRVGNFGLKPEIAAPGSGIVAARLPGSFPTDAVNKYYIRLSGTSMATPHVAGSAAILAQEHPSWTGQQLKAALMASAKPLSGAGVFAVGAGRVDVATAVTSTLRTLTADVGFATLSNAPAAPVRQQRVRYRNDGSHAVTLHLALHLTATNGAAAPAGVVTLSPTTLLLPAHHEGSVTVAAHPAHGAPGGYSGRLLATTKTATLDTPVAIQLQAPLRTLSVKLRDAQGHAVSADDAFATAQNVDTGAVFYLAGDDSTDNADSADSSGAITAAVPAGRYRLIGALFGPPDPIQWTKLTEFARQVQVGGNTTLTVDTVDAKPFQAHLDQSGVRQDDVNSLLVTGSAIHGSTQTSTVSIVSQPANVYLSVPAQLHGLTFSYLGLWGRPLVTLHVDGTALTITDLDDNSGKGWTGDIHARVVDIGDHTDPSALPDVRGRVVLLAPSLTEDSSADAPTDAQLTALASALRDNGAQIVLSDFYFADTSTIPVLQMYADNDIQNLRDQIAAGHDSVHIVGRPLSPTRFSLFRTASAVPPNGVNFSFRRRDLARVDEAYRQPTAGQVKSNDLVLVDAPATGLLVTSSPAFYPTRRVDYFSPAVAWSRLTGVGFSSQPDTFEAADELSEPRIYRSGEHSSDSWGTAPFSPALPELNTDPQTGKPLPWAYREGNKIYTTIAPFASASPTHQLIAESLFFGGNPLDTGSTKLYRGTHLVDASDVPGVAGFSLSKRKAHYRLVLDATRTVPGWPLSPHVRASWTFNSGSVATRSGKAALPLLSAHLHLGLGLHDDAPRNRPLTGTVDVDHQQGSAHTAIHALSVELSYDGGTTWAAAKVTRIHGGSFRVRIPAAPTAAKSVTMRLKTSDVAGGQLRETIARAYNL